MTIVWYAMPSPSVPSTPTNVRPNSSFPTGDIIGTIPLESPRAAEVPAPNLTPTATEMMAVKKRSAEATRGVRCRSHQDPAPLSSSGVFSETMLLYDDASARVMESDAREQKASFRWCRRHLFARTRATHSSFSMRFHK